MRRRAPKTLLALAPLLALVACQDPDVGNSCDLRWNESWARDGTPPPPTAAVLYSDQSAADYFQSGNTKCEHLICIVSPTNEARFGGEVVREDKKVNCIDAAGCGYCSKPCVSNDDCFEKETGLVCRQMVLDPVFLRELDEQTKKRYLSEIEFSSYCGAPR